MEQLELCPICDSPSFDSHLVCEDFTVSHEKFAIVKCNSCGFLFTNPRPYLDDIGQYYESDEYISHSNTSKGLVNWVYQKVRNHTLNQKVKLLTGLTNGRAILDYGSGTGEFLDRCKLAGWDTTGIEPSPQARAFAQQEYDLGISEPEHLFDLPESSFDVITLWHVLEHVHNLKEVAQRLQLLIKPNGYLIVAVPNHTSFDSKQYGEYWAAYDVPRHLYHFTPQNISRLFGAIGMDVVKTLPMKFDSFYVSMLSEKYQHGKSKTVSAMLTGWQSNLKANNSNNQYSSQIYILQNREA